MVSASPGPSGGRRPATNRLQLAGKGHVHPVAPIEAADTSDASSGAGKPARVNESNVIDETTLFTSRVRCAGGGGPRVEQRRRRRESRLSRCQQRCGTGRSRAGSLLVEPDPHGDHQRSGTLSYRWWWRRHSDEVFGGSMVLRANLEEPWRPSYRREREVVSARRAVK
jgi:hypothetical protein